MTKVKGLQANAMVPRVRLVDNNPADVLRSDVISIPSEGTDHTLEFLSPSIVLVDNPTIGTSSASISWVYKSERNSGELRLVLDKPSELAKSPRELDASLSLPNRYPTSDAPEDLKGNSSFGVFGLRNKSLGYGVVDLSGEPRFLATPFLEQSLCGLGPLLLKFSPQPCVSVPQTVEVASRISVSIRISGYVLDPEVHANPILGFEWNLLWRINSGYEIENSISQYEVSLSSYPVHSPLLIFSNDYRNFDPALQREHGGVVQALPGQYSLVIDHCAMFFENGPNGLVSLVRFYYLANCSDSHLRTETEALPNLIVEDVMEGNLVGEALLESNSSDVVAGFVEPLHRLFEKAELLLVWSQPHQQRLLQATIEEKGLYFRVPTFEGLDEPVG